jgi:hypothetical protein
MSGQINPEARGRARETPAHQNGNGAEPSLPPVTPEVESFQAQLRQSLAEPKPGQAGRTAEIERNRRIAAELAEKASKGAK